MKYKFDNTTLTIPKDIRHETYDDDGSYGINIYHGAHIYNLHYNKLAKWGRLIISSKNNEGGWKDLPYNQGTYWMLPVNIKVDESSQ
jgi:hypothetical protein